MQIWETHCIENISFLLILILLQVDRSFFNLLRIEIRDNSNNKNLDINEKKFPICKTFTYEDLVNFKWDIAAIIKSTLIKVLSAIFTNTKIYLKGKVKTNWELCKKRTIK